MYSVRSRGVSAARVDLAKLRKMCKIDCDLPSSSRHDHPIPSVMRVNQPSNQIKWVSWSIESMLMLMLMDRLTNVSIVRLKKGGKRFEVGFKVVRVTRCCN